MSNHETLPTPEKSNENNQKKSVEQKFAVSPDSVESKEREGLVTNKDLLEVLPILVQAIGRQWEYTTSLGSSFIIMKFDEIKKEWKTMTKEELKKRANDLMALSKSQTQVFINDNKRLNNGKFVSPPNMLIDEHIRYFFGQFKDWALSPQEAVRFSQILSNYQFENTPAYEKELSDKIETSLPKNSSKKKKQK